MQLRLNIYKGDIRNNLFFAGIFRNIPKHYYSNTCLIQYCTSLKLEDIATPVMHVDFVLLVQHNVP